MDDLPVEKIAISGPTLASLIQRFSSSSGPIDGLLFGHVSLTPSTLSDDSSTTTSFSSETLIATVTSFLSSSTSLSFYSPSGRVNPSYLAPSSSSLLGWFSARRKSPLRPSMREFSVSESLSSLPNLSFPIFNSSSSSSSSLSPCIFLLLTSPIPDQAIHTHEYRAYQFRASTECFDPKSVDIVNIGPAFRGHYGAFSPNSNFPSLACELKSSGMVADKEEEESSSRVKQAAEDQRRLDQCAEGFEIGRLSRLMGSEATNYTSGLEDLYEKMLAKIENLAREVELSSAKVFEQENHNRKLRQKAARYAGSE